MALSSQTLGDELTKNEPSDSEDDSIAAFAKAFETYFYEATTIALATPGTLSGARSAMENAMTGLSTPGLGLSVIQAGIAAFWGVVAGSSATIWPGTLSATPPPGLGGISAALAPVMLINVTTSADRQTSWGAVASAIHPFMLGGMATLPPPAPPVPIL